VLELVREVSSKNIPNGKKYSLASLVQRRDSCINLISTYDMTTSGVDRFFRDHGKL